MSGETHNETISAWRNLSSGQEDMTTLNPQPSEPSVAAYMWVPYLVLGAVLVCLALISFLHYHLQNRGRYQDQKHKAQGIDGFVRNKKYRVTLKSNGTPYSMGKAVSLALEGNQPPTDQEEQKGSTLPPIFTGANHNRPSGQNSVTHYPGDSSVDNTKHNPENHYIVQQKSAKNSPEVHCSYLNEAFDSSGDSEKSLISKELLKKQKRAGRYRAKSHMDTESTDLDLEDMNRETPEVLESKRPKRKLPMQKSSVGNNRNSGRQTVMPPLPGRSFERQSSEQTREHAGRKRISSDSERSSRVHPE